MENLRASTKKVLIGIAGGIVTLAGLVMIPYPGPGWLVVFAGLAILATEFVFASRILTYVRDKYERWVVWLKEQHVSIRLLVLAFTGVVVLATVYLLNVFGFANTILNLQTEWLISPFFR